MQTIRSTALRALTRYVEIHGKEKSFGNARYVRTEFLPDSLDAQTTGSSASTARTSPEN